MHTVSGLQRLHFKNTISTLGICGDGRSYSPGYYAKFGRYSLVNSFSGEILNFCVSGKS